MPGHEVGPEQVAGLRLRSATPNDLDEIVALADALRLDESMASPDRPGEKGFFIAGWERADYQRFLAEAEHFRVAEHDDEFVGFFLAYSSRHAEFEPALHRQISRFFGEYLLCEQMAIKPDWARRGVGSAFVRELAESNLDIPAVSESSLTPLNQVSANFHRLFGCRPVSQITRDDGRVTQLWLVPVTQGDLGGA